MRVLITFLFTVEPATKDWLKFFYPSMDRLLLCLQQLIVHHHSIISMMSMIALSQTNQFLRQIAKDMLRRHYSIAQQHTRVGELMQLHGTKEKVDSSKFKAWSISGCKVPLPELDVLLLFDVNSSDGRISLWIEWHQSIKLGPFCCGVGQGCFFPQYCDYGWNASNKTLFFQVFLPHSPVHHLMINLKQLNQPAFLLMRCESKRGCCNIVECAQEFDPFLINIDDSVSFTFESVLVIKNNFETSQKYDHSGQLVSNRSIKYRTGIGLFSFGKFRQFVMHQSIDFTQHLFRVFNLITNQWSNQILIDSFDLIDQWCWNQHDGVLMMITKGVSKIDTEIRFIQFTQNHDGCFSIHQLMDDDDQNKLVDKYFPSNIGTTFERFLVYCPIDDKMLPILSFD